MRTRQVDHGGMSMLEGSRARAGGGQCDGRSAGGIGDEGRIIDHEREEEQNNHSPWSSK